MKSDLSGSQRQAERPRCRLRSTLTCLDTRPATSWQTRGPIHGRCKAIWDTARFNRRSGTLNWHRLGSKIFGGKHPSVMSALPPKADIRHAIRMSALGGGFNRSTQHLLILLEEEVCDGGDCTDMVHAAAEG